MKILVIGGGGREHALTWKLSQDSRRPDLFCAPGNAGTAAIATNLNINAEDLDALVKWTNKHLPDLTVVGPEAPLCAGITDRLQSGGHRVFGPTAAAARLEGSKSFAKEVMRSARVPTAWAERFTRFDAAQACVRERGAPIVIKADGLTAGKGVAVCSTVEEAETALEAMLGRQTVGSLETSVLVEEYLEGEEVSILGLVDGDHFVLLSSSQDHKRAFEGDRGPNTGGMGAYSPAPVVSDDLWPCIQDEVFARTIGELKKRDIVFKGVLYAGLMITEDGPRVLEFNVRFGDPETQCILPRLQVDMIPVLEACVDGTLSDDMVDWADTACVCVVMAARGYPGNYTKAELITGIEQAENIDEVLVFHAGTSFKDGKVVTAGGRVLGVTAVGPNLAVALDTVYEAVGHIQWEGRQFRRDIGVKALAAVQSVQERVVPK